MSILHLTNAFSGIPINMKYLNKEIHARSTKKKDINELNLLQWSF